MNYVGQRQLMAILLTDVVNYSDQAAKNEEQTLRQLEQDFSLIRRLCRERGGEVLKSTGDGLLVSFLCSEKAIEAAEEAQRALLQPGSHLRHRIGIHAGDVYRQEKDILGDGVNLAARLTEIAESGGFVFLKLYTNPPAPAIRDSISVQSGVGSGTRPRIFGPTI